MIEKLLEKLKNFLKITLQNVTNIYILSYFIQKIKRHFFD